MGALSIMGVYTLYFMGGSLKLIIVSNPLKQNIIWTYYYFKILVWLMNEVILCHRTLIPSQHLGRGDKNHLPSIGLLMTYPNLKSLYTWTKICDHENPRALENHPKALGPVYTTVEKASGWSRMLGQDMVI
jgi:hypothetical protein